MPHTAIRAEIDQTLDRELNLAPQVAFDRRAPQRLAKAFDLGVIEFLDLFVVRNSGGVQNCPRTCATDPIDRRQADVGVLMRRNIDAGNTSHYSNPSYPWRCLWRGSEQITRTLPLRLMTLQFLQIRFTEGRTFMSRLPKNPNAAAAQRTCPALP